MSEAHPPTLPRLLWHLTSLTPSSRALGPLPFFGDFAGLTLPSRGKHLRLVCQLSPQPRVKYRLRCHGAEEAFPVSPGAILFPHLGARWPGPPEHLTQVTRTRFVAWSRAVWWGGHESPQETPELSVRSFWTCSVRPENGKYLINPTQHRLQIKACESGSP